MTYEETITALRCADTGSRELDAVVYEALGGTVLSNVLAGYWREDGGGQVPDYTTSLDAAFALLDDIIPTSRLLSLSRIKNGDSAGWACTLQHASAHIISTTGATAPLALSATIVSAWNRPCVLRFRSTAAAQG